MVACIIDVGTTIPTGDVGVSEAAFTDVEVVAEVDAGEGGNDVEVESGAPAEAKPAGVESEAVLP